MKRSLVLPLLLGLAPTMVVLLGPLPAPAIHQQSLVSNGLQSDHLAQAHSSDIAIEPFETETYAVRIFRPTGAVPPYMNLFNKKTGTLVLNKVIIYETSGDNEPRYSAYHDSTLSVEIIGPLHSHQRQLRVTQNGTVTTELEALPPISATRIAFETPTHAVRIFQREGQAQLYMNVYNQQENQLELDGIAVTQRGNESPDGPIEYAATLPNGVRYVVTGHESHHLSVVYPAR